MNIDGRDIPIVKLRPLQQRRISKRERDRIATSIAAVGLIEPLVVFPDGEHFIILDGFVRYQILLELGIETVPCILWTEKEAFTSNRMVNHLSPVQESRMIRKSLEELDHETVAGALGMKGIGHRLHDALLKELSDRVIAAFDGGKISKACASDLCYVTKKRQDEILAIMVESNDFSNVFARSLILKSKASQRSAKGKRAKNPWDRTGEKRTGLLKRLQEAEEKHDFYSSLYQQYMTNILKLVIYVRSLISNENVLQHMRDKHAELLVRLEGIVAMAEG